MFGRRKPAAIVHIGTEKTGSTSIQDFLYQNHELLRRNGYLFPFRSSGLISNHRLVLFSQREPDIALAAMNRFSLENAAAIADWKRRFTENLRKEVRTFQQRHWLRARTGSPTVIYSSEHFHSRVTDPEDIARLRDVLLTMHDHVRIIVYARRQDHMAMSAHNTSIQGGNTRRFRFDNIPEADTPYYDLLGLTRRWADVFGNDAITVRQYARQSLVDGDVAKDFATVTGIDAIAKPRVRSRSAVVTRRYRDTDWDRFLFKVSNPRLSHTALEILLEFNAMAADDERLGGADKESIRQLLISELHDVDDNFGTLLPSREEAERFYANYRESNQVLAVEWMDGDGFSEDFSRYPISPDAVPAVDVSRSLERVVSRVLTQG